MQPTTDATKAEPRQERQQQPAVPSAEALRPLQPESRTPAGRHRTKGSDSAKRESLTDEGSVPERPAEDGQPYRERLGAAYFELEYRGYSDAEITAEKSRVYSEWNAVKKSALDKRYEDGLSAVIGRDAQGKSLFKGFSNERIYSTRVLRDRPGDVFLVELPFGEYADIYDMGERWVWLMREETRRSR